MSLPPEHGSPPRDMPDGAAPPSKAALQVLDLAVLRSTAGGDRLLTRELMTLFLETTGPISKRLTAAMQAGDCLASQRESHALSSAAGLIGATAMLSVLKKIEAFSFQGHHALLAGQLAELTLAFASVVAAVTQALQDFDTNEKTIL